MNKIDQLLRGAVDMHCHSGPGIFKRLLDHAEAAKEAAAVGMSGLVLKDQHSMTAVAATLINKHVLPEGSPLTVFGSLVLNNATELHFGAEYYLLFRQWLIPVRAGFYTDPAHAVYTTVENEALRRLFPHAKDEVHGTFGFGFVLQNKIQLDAAVNVSPSVTEALLSAVFRF